MARTGTAGPRAGTRPSALSSASAVVRPGRLARMGPAVLEVGGVASSRPISRLEVRAAAVAERTHPRPVPATTPGWVAVVAAEPVASRPETLRTMAEPE